MFLNCLSTNWRHEQGALIQPAATHAWWFRNQRGVTYIMVMFAIVLMGIAMTVVSKQWTVVMKRDKEAELLFRGNRIKTAIELYAADYQVRKASRPNVYPLKLEQLTEKPKRYLPVVYKDPITGQDFELIKVGAEIRGVKSRSKDKPLDMVHFKNADTYDQIAFQVQAPASQPAIPGQGMFNKCPPACPQANPQSPQGQ